VIPRQNSFTSAGQRSFLDESDLLTQGTLTRFYLYIANQAFIAQTANIHLQIWRPTIVSLQYTLVWDLRVSVSLSYSLGALYTVSQLGLTMGVKVNVRVKVGVGNDDRVQMISIITIISEQKMVQ
jgi:hypothetical protein